MSLILVVEREARHIERIEDALTSEGWRVKVVGDRQEAAAAAAEDAPDLVLVSSSQRDARVLLESFGRKGGGPGSVVLLSESEVEVPNAEKLGADDLISKPFTAKELRMVVRRCLARVSDQLSAASQVSEAKLTSSDIFGDLLDEVEGRPSTLVTPPRPADADIDRKIEETLSGVLEPRPDRAPRKEVPPAGKVGGKRSAKEAAADNAVEQLLSDTLSGLDLGARRSRRESPASAHPPAMGSAPAVPGAASSGLESAPASPPTAPPSPSGSAPASKPPPPPAEGSSPADESTPDAAPEPAPSSAPEREAIAPPPPSTPKLKIGPSRKEPLEGLESLYATQRIPVKKEKRTKEAAKEPAAGEEFGQYTLEERIARGGMAEVWRARMKGVEGFQKRVAIKRILPHLTDSGDFVDMFIDEAKLAAQLNHSNIIHIYDLGKIGDDYYIAMEYVDGKDLRSILNRARAVDRPMPHSLALLIAARLAGALDYAHRKRDFDNRDLGLVHRDVSPQNVLISSEGDIKLCDFGIAKAVSKVSKTQMGALKGKLQYMSPEQARGKKVDPRTDIFSLGAVLFEMLTGRRLFAGDSEVSVLEAVREGRIVEPREIDSTIPPEINACVVKALAKDPEQRYQTAGELESELNRLLQQLKPAVGPSDLAQYVHEVFSLEAMATEKEQEEKTGEGEGAEGKGDKAIPAQQEFPPLAPASGASAEEAEGRGRGLLLGAVAALIVVTIVAVFVVRYRVKSGPATPAASSEVAPPAPTPTPTASKPSSGGTEMPSVAQGAATESAPESGKAQTSKPAATAAPHPGVPAGGAKPAAKTGAKAAVPSAEVQKLVSQELQRREEALRKKFELQQKKLQAELAKTQSATSEPKPKEKSASSEPSLEGSTKVAVKPKPSTLAASGASPAQKNAAGSAEMAKPSASEKRVGPATAAQGETGGSPQGDQSSAAESSAPQVPAAGIGEAKPTSPAHQLESGESTPAPQAPAASSAPPKPSVKRGDLVSPGPGVTPPELVKFVKPPYPPIAQRFKVQGTVVLTLLVDENGNVAKVRLLRGVGEKVGINEAAIAAAKKARFKPASKDGVKVKMWFTLTVPFQL
ncbi:MAG TPA: TonB family protein [Thermoanaerobaculia bacterium]|nr:TonB family protein [Thermoanaerobaculia bacterium]